MRKGTGSTINTVRIMSENHPDWGCYRIAKSIDREKSQVRKIMRQLNIPLQIVNSKNPCNTSLKLRWTEDQVKKVVVAYYNQFKTLREVGKDFGVSYERIRQIMEKHGLRRHKLRYKHYRGEF